MKTNRQPDTRQTKPASNKPRPEIRDDMDSRHRKPEDYKGDMSHKNEKKKKS